MSSKYPTSYAVKLPVITETVPANGDAPEAQKTRHIGAEIVKVVLTQGNEAGGLKIDDIRKRVAILDRIDADPTELILLENEKQFLVGAFDDFKFGVANKHIVHTYDAIKGAEARPTLASV